MKELIIKYHGDTLAAKIKYGLPVGEKAVKYAKCFENKYPPYRMKMSGKHNGVVLINDSGASGIHATYFSLQQINAPVIWIVWNDEADAAFEQMDLALLHRVKKIIVIGKAYLKLDYLFGQETCVEEAGYLEDAFRRALKDAQAGDYILFSPATKKIEGIGSSKELYEHTEKVLKKYIK